MLSTGRILRLSLRTSIILMKTTFRKERIVRIITKESIYESVNRKTQICIRKIQRQNCCCRELFRQKHHLRQIG